MGNYNSCKSCTSPMIKNTIAARVILPGGEIRQFRGQVKAAELMLDSPNCFLVNTKSLVMGKRFLPLSADEDLELGNVYVMFPMRRKKSVVTAADMTVVLMSTKAPARRIAGSGMAKVEDSKEGEVEELIVKLDEMEGVNGVEYGYKLGGCRSKKPLLATISEEPLCSR